MPDIHIGESPFDEKKGIIKVKMFFHVPTRSGTSNSYPGLPVSLDNAGNPLPVSTAPGVTEAELTALRDGGLCEVFDTKPFQYDGSVERKNEIKTEVRGLWAGVASKKQATLDKEYSFYGVPLARI